MRNVLEESFESRTGVNELGRLRRPVATAIVGSFVSFAVGVLILARSGGAGATPMAFVATFVVGSLLSIAYAIMGARVSKNAANRLLGIAGMLLILAGVAYIVYLVKSSPF
jgi:VIT1/CCC1 family predicted Fe2+/Mn2+ transporter